MLRWSLERRKPSIALASALIADPLPDGSAINSLAEAGTYQSYRAASAEKSAGSDCVYTATLLAAACSARRIARLIFAL